MDSQTLCWNAFYVSFCWHTNTNILPLYKQSARRTNCKVTQLRKTECGVLLGCCYINFKTARTKMAPAHMWVARCQISLLISIVYQRRSHCPWGLSRPNYSAFQGQRRRMNLRRRTCWSGLLHIRSGLAYVTQPMYEQQREKTYLLVCAPNDASNQPAPPRSLIRGFFVRLKKLCIRGYTKCVQWRFWSDCANAQSDLNLHWARMSVGTFSDVMTHNVR